MTKRLCLLPTAARTGQEQDRRDETWMGLEGGGVSKGVGLNLASLGKGGAVSHPGAVQK